MPGQLDAALPKVPPIQPTRPRSFRWLFSLFALITVLTGCSSLYGMWENSRYNLQASVTSFVKSLAGGSKSRTSIAAVAGRRGASSAARAPRNLNAPAEKKRAPDDTAAQPVAAASSTPDPNTGFRVEIAAIEPTWLSIIADEKEIYSGVLQAAETKVLQGHDTARIRAGNAGGVNVIFNGKTIGVLGPRGEVRTVVFTKSNYEIVGPSAT